MVKGSKLIKPDSWYLDKFLLKVDKNGPIPPHCQDLGPCWLWTGATDGHGYGHLTMRRKSIKAYRASFMFFIGPISEGLWVLHKCDNPPCVRPDHLFLGTQTDNLRDAAIKGRIGGGPSRREFCKRGHPLNGDNILVLKAQFKTKEGIKRQCRECTNQRQWLGA